METVDQLLERWPDRRLEIGAGDNAGASAGDIVVIATPWDGATQTAVSVDDHLRGKVVICMANALTRIGKEFQPLVPPRGSVAASVQAAVPHCMVAAAFHHVPAKELGDLEHPIESDVLVCSDHPAATQTHVGDRRQDPEHAPARRRRALAGDADRVVHRRPPPAQRQVPHAGRGEVHRDPGGAHTRAAGVNPPMRLYDTARREVVPFEPGPIVSMYTCGITPYDSAHLGHAAVYVSYDVLQRRLVDLGHTVRCVRNITDVDDSILGKARELGVHYLDLAAAEIARFDDDMAALGLLPAWSRAPRHLSHPRHPRLHRHGARQGVRLPGRRRRVLRRLEVRAVRLAQPPQPRRDARHRPRARRQRRRPAQA